MRFDPHQHASRFYKSACLCRYPMQSRHDRQRCAECGGIIPLHRQLEIQQAQEENRQVMVVVWGILLMLAFLLWFSTRY